MKWTQITIKTTTEAEDIIISEMYELGLMGAQIEDHVPLSAREKEEMFVDILPDTVPDDGRALLHFFVETKSADEETKAHTEAAASGFTGNGISGSEDNSYSFVSGENVVEDLPALLSAMKEKLSEISSYMEIGEGTIEVAETEDKDWVNNWKEFFKPFSIGDLCVCPSWEEAPVTEGKVLRIDPGSAFGTGMHETTRLCIMALKEYVNENTRLLDVGTGSGILGIVSLLYGAKSVTATDLDPCAVEAVAENLEMNGFDDTRFSLRIGNLITDEKTRDFARAEDGYDIVTANILAEVLLSLTPVAAGYLKAGGIYITSGILEGKEGLVQEACEKAGLQVLDVRALGEWRCVIAKKPEG